MKLGLFVGIPSAQHPPVAASDDLPSDGLGFIIVDDSQFILVDASGFILVS